MTSDKKLVFSIAQHSLAQHFGLSQKLKSTIHRYLIPKKGSLFSLQFLNIPSTVPVHIRCFESLSLKLHAILVSYKNTINWIRICNVQYRKRCQTRGLKNLFMYFQKYLSIYLSKDLLISLSKYLPQSLSFYLTIEKEAKAEAQGAPKIYQDTGSGRLKLDTSKMSWSCCFKMKNVIDPVETLEEKTIDPVNVISKKVMTPLKSARPR